MAPLSTGVYVDVQLTRDKQVITFVGQDPGKGDAACVVKATALTQLLQPAEHDVAPLPILEAVGRIQHITQVQQMGPCSTHMAVWLDRAA